MWQQKERMPPTDIEPFHACWGTRHVRGDQQDCKHFRAEQQQKACHVCSVVGALPRRDHLGRVRIPSLAERWMPCIPAISLSTLLLVLLPRLGDPFRSIPWIFLA